MPSKTSRQSPSLPFRWKVARDCSERKLAEIAAELAQELKGGDRLLLEGEMGAGKTTFAKGVLTALGVNRPPEGSPTFALAHEYDCARPGLRVVHIDFYRIRSADEIDEAGLPDHFWNSEAIVIAEWTSLWSEFEEKVLESGGRNWTMLLKISEKSQDLRDLTITRL